MKKVSIVIPCYKYKQLWMDRLFDSVVHQSIGMEQLEIICVIDASPDDTFERLKVYEEHFPASIMIVNVCNKIGPGGARTIGLNYSSGEYVAFLDQDDCVEYCMYDKLYHKAKEYDADIVECYSRRDGGRLTGSVPTGKPDRFINIKTAEDRKKYFRDDNPEGRLYWAKIYKREFLVSNNICFPENITYDDNFFKGLSFYCANKIYVVEEYLHHWVINNESISMLKGFQTHLDRMKVELLKLEEYNRRGLLDLYHDEMEYIFIEQYFANTVNTIFTRNCSMPFSLLENMKDTISRLFPQYEKNKYIQIKHPVWSMGRWIENAIKGIRQVTGNSINVPITVFNKIKSLSFLDLLKADITEEDLNWYCRIYVAFDRIASKVDYSKLQ